MITRVELRFDSEFPDDQSKMGNTVSCVFLTVHQGKIGQFPKGSKVFSDRVERKLSHGLPVRGPVEAVGTVPNRYTCCNTCSRYYRALSYGLM